MPRASHKKSRLGCVRCKSRHVKCDETKPRCVNCTTAGVSCSYEANANLAAAQVKDHISTSAQLLDQPSHSPAQTSSSATNGLTPRSDSDFSGLNLLHLELLHTWSSNTCTGFLINQSLEHVTNYANTTVEYGLKYPFLMLQILAVAALHTSIVEPTKRNEYHQHAVSLQSDALSSFNKVVARLTETDVVAAFLFSSITGFHVFCDIFTYRNPDFGKALEELTGCIRLLQGVLTVIHGGWERVESSGLRQFIDTLQEVRHNSRPVTLTEARRMVDEADIGTDSKTAYSDALRHLELLFGVQESAGLDDLHGSRMILSWFVLIPRAYSELLSERRPEALIILAHYAVLLHKQRDFWGFGDSGEFLILSIHKHLGSRWEEWLSGPLAVIQCHA